MPELHRGCEKCLQLLSGDALKTGVCADAAACAARVESGWFVSMCGACGIARDGQQKDCAYCGASLRKKDDLPGVPIGLYG